MTSWRPKIVALDVDGTMVDWENRMTDTVREAVHAIKDSGVHVVISTGRAIPGVLDAARNLRLDDGIAVASNGAVVHTYSPVEVVHTVTFDASEAVRRVLEHIPDALVAVEEVGTGYRISAPFPEWEIDGTVTIQTVDELVAEPVTRVIIRAPEHDVEEFGRLVHGLGLNEVNYNIGYTAWLDIAPDGVSKASGLEVVCERLGVDRADVLAVGDGMNDYEMLRWAGRGVAMGQGSDELKAVADDVTGTVLEDGLATELRRWL
ncbi:MULTISPECIES: HAD family hydrolase [Aeromicrobium]|jgi:Cof subfamily protein (haloacid dehalogenase superfamily)|uniref:Haloacid dehalogenase n=1 Tax=Aeromicrobium erythreum TaxID=2041 RepID=A0A0U4BEP2_9ACTN|nr:MULTISPECIES: HAD family hydrolase [Aeromicrobium]ALX06100.1 haloacid dehalogenase [Aeromicrobium erythreum]